MIQPGLYIVALPIGNARDITLRALDTLTNVNQIFCEDTRITRKLMTIYGIRKKLLSYHEHNAEKIRPKIIDMLLSKKSIALVCDAGTPLINDPGFKLVSESLAQKISVFSLPGPSAVINSLTLAGIPTDRFFFVGYPPSKSKKRKEWLKELSGARATLVFLENPKRLLSSLIDMESVFGLRDVAVLREMTKLHEEVQRGTIKDLINFYSFSGPPKGEITLVVGRSKKASTDIDLKLKKLLEIALKNNALKDSIGIISEATGFSKRTVYRHALQIKKNIRYTKN